MKKVDEIGMDIPFVNEYTSGDFSDEIISGEISLLCITGLIRID